MIFLEYSEFVKLFILTHGSLEFCYYYNKNKYCTWQNKILDKQLMDIINSVESVHRSCLQITPVRSFSMSCSFSLICCSKTIEVILQEHSITKTCGK